jgi:alkylhydroperoxidase family enzyme
VFTPAEQALLRFCDLLTSYPGNLDQTDLDGLAEHFSKDQVIELVLTVATANLTNRVTDGLRIPTTTSSEPASRS